MSKITFTQTEYESKCGSKSFIISSGGLFAFEIGPQEYTREVQSLFFVEDIPAIITALNSVYTRYKEEQ